MKSFIGAFADELEKLSAPSDKELAIAYEQAKEDGGHSRTSALAALRGKGKAVSRDYLSSAAIGAAATPAVALLGSVVSRKMRNRGLQKLLANAKSKRAKKAINEQMLTGPALGRAKPGDKWNTAPLMTYEDAAGKAVAGGVAGSAIQMLRDRLSGSGRD